MVSWVPEKLNQNIDCAAPGWAWASIWLCCESIICGPLVVCPIRLKYVDCHLSSEQCYTCTLPLYSGISCSDNFLPSIWNTCHGFFFKWMVAIWILIRKTKEIRKKRPVLVFSLCAWWLNIYTVIPESESNAEYCEGSSKRSLIDLTLSTSQELVSILIPLYLLRA